MTADAEPERRRLMDEPARRLHPAGVVLEAAGSIGGLVVPIVAVVLLGASGGGLARSLVYGLVALAGAVVLGIARWATTTFHVSPDGIALRAGILSPDERLVPRARIQGVDVVQGPLHRLLGLVELRVQAAGGGKSAEIVLRALDPRQARELGALLGHPVHEAEPDARWRMGAGDLLVAALTAPQAGILLPLLAGAGALAQETVRDGGGRKVLDLAPGGLGPLALLIAGLALAALLLSIGAALVAFGGFEARREGGLLRIRRGLLQRSSVTVPLARVHAVRIVESPLRQPLGLAAVRIETVAQGEEPAAARTLLPLVRRADLTHVLGSLVPGLEPPAAPLAGPPPRARRRYTLAPALAGAALGGAATLVASAAWPAIALLTLGGVAYGLRAYADAGWLLDGTHVTIRSRRVGRATLVARARRLQAESLTRTPLQARAGLATLEIAVGAGRRARLRHVEADVAAGLFARLRDLAIGVR